MRHCGTHLVVEGDGGLELAHVLVDHPHVAIGLHVELVVLDGRVVVLQRLACGSCGGVGPQSVVMSVVRRVVSCVSQTGGRGGTSS